MGNIILTGDRPTGKLHIGHFVGSLQNRVKMQNEGNFDKMYVMIADSQALTDNFNNVKKVQDNIIEVALDYLSVGIDPNKVTLFLQSQVSELTEFNFYYLNLVTLARAKRNPTVKSEMKEKGYKDDVPLGFLCYPVSQTADITAFNANIVPVGEDQLPVIEQAREIVRTFNNLYGETLIEPIGVLPDKSTCKRLPGTDGIHKMSKSLGNCIYLSDSEQDIKKKVFSMYTDENHIKVSDPGKVEGNVVFSYLDAFCEDEHFKKYLPEYNNLDELKAHYRKGGLGDVKIKNFLNSILQEILLPIRTKRQELEKDKDKIMNILYNGSKQASLDAHKNLIRLKTAMGINYFNEI